MTWLLLGYGMGATTVSATIDLNVCQTLLQGMFGAEPNFISLIKNVTIPFLSFLFHLLVFGDITVDGLFYSWMFAYLLIQFPKFISNVLPFKRYKLKFRFFYIQDSVQYRFDHLIQFLVFFIFLN